MYASLNIVGKGRQIKNGVQMATSASQFTLQWVGLKILGLFKVHNIGSVVREWLWPCKKINYKKFTIILF